MAIFCQQDKIENNILESIKNLTDEPVEAILFGVSKYIPMAKQNKILSVAESLA
jgi:hypothetical protein